METRGSPEPESLNCYNSKHDKKCGKSAITPTLVDR